jgi:PAS domain S-box-containing protein
MAVLAVSTAVAVQALVTVIGFPPPTAVLLLLAIVFSSWFAGFGPGLLALVLAVIGGDVLGTTLDAVASPATRVVNALALVVVGALASAMVLYRQTQARLLEQREHDASERRRTAEDLAHERHRLQMLMTHSPDRIYFKDRASRFVVVNPAMAQWFGVSDPHQLHGKTDFDFFTHEHAQQAFDDEQEAMRTGEAMIDKEEVETWPDGSTTWAASTKVPLRDASGTIIGTFGVSRNITERKRADEALRVAKAAAEAANLAKSQFLANMSHEIRTPLSAVVGMAEILMESGLTPEQREFAEIIHRSGNGLVGMLNDILDFSKIEAGHLELESIPFDLALAVDDVVQLLAANAEAKGLELILRMAPGTPMRLVGDPGRLRQVISNLIGNAIKFTEQGHVLVDISSEPTEDGDVRLHLAVKDTGIGIQGDKLDHIFDKFTQADASTTRRYGGTGLGLAICREIAKGMGGTLEVDSRPGSGSTFVLSITLPLAPGSSPKLPVQIDLTGVRVLVVEGNIIHQRVIAEQLTAWGCVPLCHQRAVEAQAVFCDSGCTLAIIDADLPDGSGLELGRVLRARHGTCALILLTTLGRRGDAKAAEEAGFNAYLVKPVRQIDLRDALASVRQAQLAGTLGGLITRHSLAEDRGKGSSAVYRRKQP